MVALVDPSNTPAGGYRDLNHAGASPRSPSGAAGSLLAPVLAERDFGVKPLEHADGIYSCDLGITCRSLGMHVDYYLTGIFRHRH